MGNRNLRNSTNLDEFIAWLVAKVDVGDCWTWTRGTFKTGYGNAWSAERGRGLKAHVFVWGWLVGPIPEGLELDHLCRNVLCVNPDHLEPVTPRVNTLRNYSPPSKNARRKACQRGHVFDAENTAYTPDGMRRCRACQRIRTAKWRRQRRQADWSPSGVGNG